MSEIWERPPSATWIIETPSCAFRRACVRPFTCVRMRSEMPKPAASSEARLIRNPEDIRSIDLFRLFVVSFSSREEKRAGTLVLILSPDIFSPSLVMKRYYSSRGDHPGPFRPPWRYWPVRLDSRGKATREPPDRPSDSLPAGGFPSFHPLDIPAQFDASFASRADARLAKLLTVMGRRTQERKP